MLQIDFAGVFSKPCLLPFLVFILILMALAGNTLCKNEEKILTVGTQYSIMY